MIDVAFVDKVDLARGDALVILTFHIMKKVLETTNLRYHLFDCHLRERLCRCRAPKRHRYMVTAWQGGLRGRGSIWRRYIDIQIECRRRSHGNPKDVRSLAKCPDRSVLQTQQATNVERLQHRWEILLSDHRGRTRGYDRHKGKVQQWARTPR